MSNSSRAPSFVEDERPSEWIRWLTENGSAYGQLVAESGIARAAYRVARARCRTATVAMPTPTLREVRAAAHEIFSRVGTTSALPSSAAFAAECRAANLLVS
jgi:hypothetical protein